MNIGIFTYGTRGDVQPYIALALGLMNNGHQVTIAAPENFKAFVEDFGITFHPLFGNAEEMMNSPEGQSVLQAENTIKLMKYFFKVLREIKAPLRKSYLDGISKVDYIIANNATLAITSAIAEKQNKKIALTYFMPPVVLTDWLAKGDKPVYMGFGSNGVGNTEKFISILNDVIAHTNERILFCYIVLLFISF